MKQVLSGIFALIVYSSVFGQPVNSVSPIPSPLPQSLIYTPNSEIEGPSVMCNQVEVYRWKFAHSCLTSIGRVYWNIPSGYSATCVNSPDCTEIYLRRTTASPGSTVELKAYRVLNREGGLFCSISYFQFYGHYATKNITRGVALPEPLLRITGPSSHSCQSGVLTFQATTPYPQYFTFNSNGIEGVNWIVPQGWTITSGQGTQQITVLTDGTAGNKEIQVSTISQRCDLNFTARSSVQYVPPATPSISDYAFLGEHDQTAYTTTYKFRVAGSFQQLVWYREDFTIPWTSGPEYAEAIGNNEFLVTLPCGRGINLTVTPYNNCVAGGPFTQFLQTDPCDNSGGPPEPIEITSANSTGTETAPTDVATATTLYPNPANDHVTIGGLKEQDIASIVSVSVEGRQQNLRAMGNGDGIGLDVRNLPIGWNTIIVRLKTGEVQRHRVLINR